MPVRAAILRPLLILLAGWLLLEYVVLELLAARIGWGAVLVIMSLKGGCGLILLVMLTLAAARAGRKAGPGKTLEAMIFPVISGILIALPGLLPMLFGIALFSPSLRIAVAAWWRTRSMPAQDPRLLELEANEWKEIGTKKARRRPKSTKPPLERQPPSV